MKTRKNIMDEITTEFGSIVNLRDYTELNERIATYIFNKYYKVSNPAEVLVIPQGELNVCEQCEECFVSTLTSTFDKPRYACKAHGKLFEELLGDTTLTIKNFGCNKFVSKHSEPQTV